MNRDATSSSGANTSRHVVTARTTESFPSISRTSNCVVPPASRQKRSETLAALKLSIDGLKAQIDKQAHTMARGEDVAIIRQRVESLRKQVADLDNQMGSSLFASSGGAQILSAPGKDVTQRIAPSFGAASAYREVPNDSLASIDAQGVSVSDLPRYERSVSPEGKLILRKVQ